MLDFEFLEHTADIAVRVYGRTLEELFVDSARAMFSLITDYKSSGHKERDITLEAESFEDLLVYWLNELLSIFYSYNFLPESYNIKIKKGENCSLEGEVKGEYLPSCNINTEIKAATYHDVKIEEEKGKLRVDIVFDV